MWRAGSIDLIRLMFDVGVIGVVGGKACWKLDFELAGKGLCVQLVELVAGLGEGLCGAVFCTC